MRGDIGRLERPQRAAAQVGSGAGKTGRLRDPNWTGDRLACANTPRKAFLAGLSETQVTLGRAAVSGSSARGGRGRWVFEDTPRRRRSWRPACLRARAEP